jgi:hypothetical protein
MDSLGDMNGGFLKALFEGLATVKIRRSALAPFLSACLFVTIPCFVIGAFCTEPLRYYVVGLGAVPLLLFAVASMYLLFADRDRLHTEEHLERRQALEIVETKGRGLVLTAVDIVNMVNPEPERKKLTDGSQRDEAPNG